MIRPPWASAACLATARPRPIPSGLPVTNGSNRVRAISAGGPGPVVRDLDLDPVAVAFGDDFDVAARPRRFHRVADQVAEQVPELVARSDGPVSAASGDL